MRGRIKGILAMKMLTEALGLLGAETPAGQTAVKMLALGGKVFGDASSDVSRQEVKLMGEQVPPVSSPTEAQGNAFGKIASMKPPGGAPVGGTPPMMPAQPAGPPVAA
jgi:hypothetical protein